MKQILTIAIIFLSVAVKAQGHVENINIKVGGSSVSSDSITALRTDLNGNIATTAAKLNKSDTASMLSAKASTAKVRADSIVQAGRINTSITNIATNTKRLKEISQNFSLPKQIRWLGDSYTQWPVISRPQQPDTIYAIRLQNHYGLAGINYGSSGAGISTQARTFNTIAQDTSMVSVLAGLNDVALGGSNYKTSNKIINSLSSIIANAFLTNYKPAGGAGIVRSGTWTTGFPGNVIGGKSSNGATTQTINDSISYTFTDSTVVFGGFGSDSVTYNYSTCTVYIDNVAVDYINQNNMTDGILNVSVTNDRISFARIYRGLSFGTHKITIVNTSGASRFLTIDYFGNLVPSKYAAPVAIFDVPILKAATYPAITPPYNVGSIAATVAINFRIDSLINTMSGYPVFNIKTNDYLDTITGLNTVDNVHPNNFGDRQLTQAFLAKIPLASVFNNSASGRVDSIRLVNSGLIYTTPSAFSLSEKTAVLNQTLANQSNYTLLGRGSGTGAPSFLSAIDSNWIPALHSQTYYDGLYGTLTQQNTNIANIALKANTSSPTFTGTVTIPNGGILSTPASMTATNIIGLPLTTGVTGVLPSANGGTNNSTVFTAGSVVFAGTGGKYQQNNSNFFWDSTNSRLGIGTSTPVSKLEVVSGTVKVVFNPNSAASLGVLGTSSNHTLALISNNNVWQTILANGNIGIGTTTPTAKINIAAGTATANTAPLKLTAGTNLTTPEAGAVEFDGTNYFATTGSTRYILTRTLTGTAAPATTPAAVGIQFVDTVNAKVYVSTGTSSSADWTILN